MATSRNWTNFQFVCAVLLCLFAFIEVGLAARGCRCYVKTSDNGKNLGKLQQVASDWYFVTCLFLVTCSMQKKKEDKKKKLTV